MAPNPAFRARPDMQCDGHGRSLQEHPEVDCLLTLFVSRHGGPTIRTSFVAQDGGSGVYMGDAASCCSLCFKAGMRVTCTEEGTLGSSTCLSLDTSRCRECSDMPAAASGNLGGSRSWEELSWSTALRTGVGGPSSLFPGGENSQPHWLDNPLVLGSSSSLPVCGGREPGIR